MQADTCTEHDTSQILSNSPQMVTKKLCQPFTPSNNGWQLVGHALQQDTSKSHLTPCDMNSKKQGRKLNSLLKILAQSKPFSSLIISVYAVLVRKKEDFVVPLWRKAVKMNLGGKKRALLENVYLLVFVWAVECLASFPGFSSCSPYTGTEI